MVAALPAVEAMPEPAPMALPDGGLLEPMPVPLGAVVPAVPLLMPAPPEVPLLVPALPAMPLLMPVLPAVPPGCMAGEPEVVDPEPVAAGRSVGGVVAVCARAGTATRAEAKRQAAIWVLSIEIS
jgi:hypothetical protein